MENNKVLEKNSHKKYQCEHDKRKNICVICHGSQLCLHNKIKYRCKLYCSSEFCSCGRRKSSCRIVVEEITVNTTDKKSASFAVDLKYVLTTDRNLNARSVLILSKYQFIIG